MSIAAQTRLHANKHAVKMTRRIEVNKDGSSQHILVVATDLQLNSAKVLYNHAAVLALQSDLAAALDGDWGRGEIVPIA